MRRRFAAALACLAVLLDLVTAAERKLCEIDADCAGNGDEIFCVRDEPNNNNIRHCTYCDPNAADPERDCDPGEFCVGKGNRRQPLVTEDNKVGYPTTRIGDCAPKGFPLGEQCNPDVTPTYVDGNGNRQVQKAFCGYFTIDNNQQVERWRGVCINKVCHECAPGSVSNDGSKRCVVTGLAGSAGQYVEYTVEGGSVHESSQNSESQLLITASVLLGCIVLVEVAKLGLKKKRGY